MNLRRTILIVTATVAASGCGGFFDSIFGSGSGDTNNGDPPPGLFGNDGVTLTTKGIGSATTLQNSQCAVGFTVVNVSGDSVSLTINLVFKSPAFSGAKSVYLQALEPNASSGWVFRGTWTVP